MKRSQCGPYQESICLLAAGALAAPERGPVESHLATCADCRKYFDEVADATKPFASWKKELAQLEPDPAMQLRWANAILTADAPEPARPLRAGQAILVWCHDLIWPYRRAWAGMVVLWLVMWGINSNIAGAPHRNSSATPVAAAAMIQTIADQRQILAELFAPAGSQPAEPPRPAAPRPHSERQTWSAAC